MNLFIIGPSGCGKSTQAKLIAEKYNLTHFSTGQLFRDEIARQTQLGQEAKKYVDQGLFCPDELVLKILFSALETVNNSNFILDGFPRLIDQGIFIEKYLSDHHQPLDLIIHLDVTFEEILARRNKMGQNFQDASRSDNTPEAIAKRQSSYNDTIGPIKTYFSQNGKLFEVDGNRPIEPIFADICARIDTMK